MRVLKYFLTFFLLSFICYGNEIEIINNFFSQLNNLKEKAKDFKIESFEGMIKGEISFSESSFKMIKDTFKKAFEKEIPQNLKFNGNFRGKFSKDKDILELEYLYIFVSSDIDNFVFSQVKNDIQFLIPSLGVIVKDKKESIEKISQKEKEDTSKNLVPVNFLWFLFEYLITKQDEIKSNLIYLREGKRNGLKTFVYTLNIPEGKVEIEILENFYTFNKMRIINEKEKSDIILNYPIPAKEIEIISFLPESIEIKSRKDENILNIKLEQIKFNKLFTPSDFKIKELSLSEFLLNLFIKASK